MIAEFKSCGSEGGGGGIRNGVGESGENSLAEMQNENGS
jgi:hypothetical protein